MEPGAPQAVVAEISDADILNLEEVEYSAFRGDADSEWINTVAPRYVEPAQRYKMLSAPHRRDNADVIADGGPRPDTPDLKHVTSGTQAQRIGEIRRRLGRLLKTATLSLRALPSWRKATGSGGPAHGFWAVRAWCSGSRVSSATRCGG